MKTSDTKSPQSIIQQLQVVEATMQSLLSELSATERLTFVNALIARLYDSPRKPVAAPDKIRLVLAHRKGSSLTKEQQEKIRRLSDLTNQIYDLENGNND